MFSIFRKRPVDSVCVSYPKSGRTWVRYAFHVAGVDVRFSHGGYGTKAAEEIGTEFVSVRPENFGERNIFLHRNPLDTAVSMFYQIHKRNLTPANKEYPRIIEKLAALDLMPPTEMDSFVLHPVWGCRNICAYNAGHIAYFTGRKNSLIVRYEDLRTDPETHFANLLRFLGKRRFDIAHIVSESSFERMREVELAANAQSRRQHKLFGLRGGDTNTLKVRKGEVKGYASSLKPETIAEASAIAAGYGFAI